MAAPDPPFSAPLPDSQESAKPSPFLLLALALILLLGAFLRFYQLGAGGVGNAYYAAAVKSMLTSWHNFFFVSFEPGGSVSVDKPPLGFWIESASAGVLGVNGFALALPNALAGVLSIPLLFQLVRRPFGSLAGLTAALALAVTPVTVATERNNTIDGLLTFSVLLAAWAFLSAVSSGRLRFLLLGAVLVGLAFNIKMLAAFMPLPAFYLLYLVGAPRTLRRRLLHLTLAGVLLLAVSFSWAAAVDLTPAAQRPYVGSSSDNTEMDLIFGWNGISRLFHDASLPGLPLPGGGAGGGAGAFPGGPGRPGALAGFGNDVPAGPLRLFSQPLSEEASWLLPLALLTMLFVPLVILLAGKRKLFPDSGSRPYWSGFALWAAWLGAEVVYFSFTTGLFHPYYLIMLGPPLAALLGAGVWALQQALRLNRWLGWGLAALAVSLTAVYQVFILKDYSQYALLAAVLIAAWLGGLALLAWQPAGWGARLALGLGCAGLLVVPLAWSADVAFNPQVDQTGLPSASQAYRQTGRGLPGGFGGPPPFAGGPAPFPGGLPLNDSLIGFLEENTPPDSYLLAVDSAMQAAPIILATGRPVLTFGGFTGNDPVVDAVGLSHMVAQGRLRFILATFGLDRQKPDLAAWIRQNCSPSPQRGAGGTLYDCQP